MASPLKGISERLKISISTVNSHLFNIKKKLNLEGKNIKLMRYDVDINTSISRLNFSSRSTKDFEVFMLILEGVTDNEICEKLSITYRSVRHHRERLLIRNNCMNMQELISLFYNGKREQE